MKRIFITLTALLLASCGGTGLGPGPQCDAVPTCQEGEEEVDSCSGEPECREEPMCGRVTYCVPTSNQGGTNNGGTNNARDIKASDFDQTCSYDDECSLIKAGDPCDCPVCPDAAINTGAWDDYQDAVSSVMCEEAACPAIGCGEEFLGHCNEGTCDIREAKYTSADGFDASCDTPDDCRAVSEDEVCAVCTCPTAAINVDELDAYNAQYDVECSIGDVQCEACEPIEIDCVAGTCQLM